MRPRLADAWGGGGLVVMVVIALCTLYTGVIV